MGTTINPLDRINRLIDEASAKMGNDNRLAKALEVTRGNVSEWRAGKRACPLEAQVLMAHIAGFAPEEVLAYALVERHIDTPKGEKLLSALGKSSAFMAGFKALVACFIGFGSTALVFSPVEATTKYDVRYRQMRRALI